MAVNVSLILQHFQEVFMPDGRCGSGCVCSVYFYLAHKCYCRANGFDLFLNIKTIAL